MTLYSILQRYQTKIFLIILGVILGIIGIGYIVAPNLIYDQWIWKYYWGPVVSDASGHSVSYHGVSVYEGYTLVSEITYGLILIVALYGLYKLLKKLDIVVDWYFAVALMPYILFGPVTRVLEDTNYFYEPTVYWFISPLIYFQTTLYVLVFLFLGYFLEKRSHHTSPKTTLFIILGVFFILDGVYTLLWVLDVPFGVIRIHPGIIVLLSLIALLPIIYRFIRKQHLTTNVIIFSGGLYVLLPFVYLIGRWMLEEHWSFTYGARFDVFFLIICLVALILIIVYLFVYSFQKHENLAVYKKPLNLSMIAGHLVDGFTSYISIYDPFHMGLPSYVEKHPASNTLMVLWPPLFPLLKFVLIVLVIYFFDVLYKKELQQYTRFVNLIKIGIFILGMSPGLRDLLRVTMGV